MYTYEHSFSGPLPPPEHVTLNSQSSSTKLQWKPPYYTLNQELNDIIHVDPHITQYTVYITDNYTGGVVKVNVTETHFTYINQQHDGLCPMYQVSAWNAGGEGKLSEPVWDSTPQGKQA